MERWSPLALLGRTMQLRVHSNRVKQRIFASKKKYEEIIKLQRLVPTPMEPLKYMPSYTPEKWLPNGWCPPPPEGIPLPKDNLPFRVERSAKGKFLPVYTDLRQGGSRVVTMVRKISGDWEEMRSEMSKVCEGREVKRKQGRLEVKGRYTKELREWLAGLGF